MYMTGGREVAFDPFPSGVRAKRQLPKQEVQTFSFMRGTDRDLQMVVCVLYCVLVVFLLLSGSLCICVHSVQSLEGIVSHFNPVLSVCLSVRRFGSLKFLI